MDTATPTGARRVRTLIALAFALALAAALAVRGLGSMSATPAATVSTPAATTATATGREPAPDVMFTTADGESATLAAYRGQPLVLNFWASWCPPCVAEMGDALRPVHEAHRGELAFLGMNLQDDPSAARRIVAATGVGYDLALDPDGSVFAAFGGLGMPTTVFIDENGRIVDTHTGAITRDQLQAQVDRLLGA